MENKFKLRFTDIDMDTKETIHVYETRDHGWVQKEHFLKSLSKYNGHLGHTFLDNGYQYARESVGVITRVEAV